MSAIIAPKPEVCECGHPWDVHEKEDDKAYCLDCDRVGNFCDRYRPTVHVKEGKPSGQRGVTTGEKVRIKKGQWRGCTGTIISGPSENRLIRVKLDEQGVVEYFVRSEVEKA